MGNVLSRSRAANSAVQSRSGWNSNFYGCPHYHSRRVVVSYKRKYGYEVLGHCLAKLAQEQVHVVRWTDHPDMTIAVDRDVKNQTKPNNILTCKNEIQSKMKTLEWSQQYASIFRCSRAANSIVSDWIWPKIKLIRSWSCSCYLQEWRAIQKWRR